ncbi:protease pro-enzyme activation domain-containing protein [Amycolatopsis sp. NPDC051372]|uniref:protease pro-enzyme activation domain-containing protein n=1 Tax=unclassified Amycolatopsis TaxID=2618356 RepID=UPI003426D35D
MATIEWLRRQRGAAWARRTISPLSAALTLTLPLGAAPSASATTTRDPVASEVVTPVSAGTNVGPATTVSGRVYLAGRDPEHLAAYSADVSNPDSKNHGRYLSATQTSQRVGPTAPQADRDTGWLTSNDLRVTARTQNYVRFEGR